MRQISSEVLKKLIADHVAMLEQLNERAAKSVEPTPTR